MKVCLIVLLIIFLGTPNSSYAQTLSLSLATEYSIVEEIANEKTYDISETVGFANIKSKQYDRFKRLAAMADDQQLIDFATNHQSAVVRIYALQALKAKNVDIPDVVKEKFKNDKTKVQVINGCLIYEKSIDVLAQQTLPLVNR